MRTTIDLPDALVERTKISAAKNKTTMRNLVIQGLEKVLSQSSSSITEASAVERLRAGYSLGNQPFSREDTHAR